MRTFIAEAVETHRSGRQHRSCSLRGTLVARLALCVVVGILVLQPLDHATAQSRVAPGAVIALQGTSHLWIADDSGVLHWAGDTRALAGRFVDWGNRREVSADDLKSMRVGDPWLSAGLVKSGEPIYFAKWESEWAEPRLLHIQSIDDVQLFGINGNNYGSFVFEEPAWERRFSKAASGLQRGKLEPAVGTSAAAGSASSAGPAAGAGPAAYDSKYEGWLVGQCMPANCSGYTHYYFWWLKSGVRRLLPDDPCGCLGDTGSALLASRNAIDYWGFLDSADIERVPRGPDVPPTTASDVRSGRAPANWPNVPAGSALRSISTAEAPPAGSGSSGLSSSGSSGGPSASTSASASTPKDCTQGSTRRVTPKEFVITTQHTYVVDGKEIRVSCDGRVVYREQIPDGFEWGQAGGLVRSGSSTSGGGTSGGSSVSPSPTQVTQPRPAPAPQPQVDTRPCARNNTGDVNISANSLYRTLIDGENYGSGSHFLTLRAGQYHVYVYAPSGGHVAYDRYVSLSACASFRISV
jgi:hypothetical protein